MDRDYDLRTEAGEINFADETSVADLLSPLGRAPDLTDRASERLFPLSFPEDGVQELSIRYANGWPEERSATITVDGSDPEHFAFPSTGSWEARTMMTIRLSVPAGDVVIGISTRNGSGPDIDEVSIVSSAPASGLPGAIGGGTQALNLAAIAALTLVDSVGPDEAPEAAATDQNSASRVVAERLPAAEEAQVSADPVESPPAGEGTDPAVPASEVQPSSAGGRPAEQSSGLSSLAISTKFNPIQVKATDPMTMLDERPDATFSALAGEPMALDESAAELVAPFQTIYLQAEGGTESGDTDNDTLVRDPDHLETPSTTNPTGLRPGFTGTGYLDFGNDAGDTMTYSVTVAEAGFYDLHIRYASSTARPLNVVVNSGSPTSLPSASTDPDGSGPADGFNTWLVQKASIQLNPGPNTISLVLIGNGPNIDALAISAPGAAVDFTSVPSDVNDAPVLSGEIEDASFAVGTGGAVSLAALEASDPDGDTPTIEAYLVVNGNREALPAGLALNGASLDVAGSLPAGAYEIEILATDGDLDSESVFFTVNVETPGQPGSAVPFVLQAEDGQVVDVSTSPTAANNTQIRDADNPETPDGKILDANGLRPGSTGDGYVDFGLNAGSAGDSLTLNVDVPASGAYELHFRYANGGNAPRPLALAVNGAASSTLAFANAPTGTDDPWSHWMLQPVTVQLAPGANSVVLSIAASSLNGPNIDAVAITEVGGTPSFFAPVFTSAATANVAENATGTVLDVNASDGDGATLTYALSGNGADDALFEIDPTTGALTFKASPNFEAPVGGDNSYSVEVTVSDGTSVVTQAVTVTVTDQNEAPSGLTVSNLVELAENAAPGTVVGTVSATDPDAGDNVAYTVSDARFVVNASGQIVVADGASFDFETESSITFAVTATDGELSTEQQVTVTVGDVVEQVGPTNVVFNAASLSSYSPQDAGTGASVTDEGSTLTLDGNLWKRAPLGTNYAITEHTKLIATITVGVALPEIIGIGFDDDNSPFELADKSVYQLGGSQTEVSFVDLRSGTPLAAGQTVEIEIDLSAHAGKTINSLVFIADDDNAGNGLGSASFSGVQLVESAPQPDVNDAPIVVGGGIQDQVRDERSPIEIDLPFVDPDGDALSYTLEVRDAQGALVTDLGDLAIVDGTLTGRLGLAPSTYTVTIIADDAKGGTTSTSFDLTVEDINDAPVLNDNVAFEPLHGKVGEEFAGLDLALFSGAFSDADGDALTITVEGLPAGLSVNGEGVIVGTPTSVGNGSITIVATDTTGLRAELEIDLIIASPAVGEVTIVEAEAFTGLDDATGFYAAAAPGASGDQAIRTNPSQSGSVSTDLAQNGITEGWYQVSMTVYDENDGTARFTLKIGDTILADNISFDEGGTFVNPAQPRGNAGQAGNLKVITFTTPVEVSADTIAQITGTSDTGEYLRIDKLTFTRVDTPEVPPSAVTLAPASIQENAAAGVIGTLLATDPDGSGTLTYTTSDTRFVIEGNQLRLANGVSLDHEAGETVTVLVTVTDAQGLSTTTTLTVSVGDVNEAPVLADNATLGDVNLTEGSAQTIDLAAALGASDPDDGDAAEYQATLAGGNPLPAGVTLAGTSLVVAATVAVGVYEIEIFATDGELDSESVSFTLTVAEPGTTPPFEPITIQAETGSIDLAQAPDLNSTQLRDPDHTESNPDLQPTGLRPDFTGTGYLDFGNDAGDTVSYTVSVAEAGTYELAIRYATNGARPLDFSVNDGAATSLPFVTTDPDGGGAEEGFDHWLVQTVTVELGAGENTFSFAIPAGATMGPNLDSITITKPDASDISADEDDAPLFLSGPDAPLSGAAKDSINFNIAGQDDDIVKVEISFDGGTTRTTVLPDADGDFTASGAALTAGNYVATVFVTDDAGNVASATMPFAVAGVEAPPFSLVIEAETFTPADIEAGSTPLDTVARTPQNDEPGATAANSGPGLAFDEFGLRPGYEGQGYMDFGNEIGDAASFTINAPSAGTYQLTVRFANGGTDTRPMTLTVGGVEQTLEFPVTTPAGGTGDQGWGTWSEMTVDIELSAGTNTISFANDIANGPNIDNVTISRDGTDPVDTRDQIRFEEVVKINFQPPAGQTSQGLPSGYQTPAGYVADTGAAFGDRGNGLSFGWVTEASVADGTANGTIPVAQPANSHWYKNIVPGASDLQKTYAHFEQPGSGAARAWEMALENGTYQVTMSVGDTAGAFDSTYAINVEGQDFMPDWVPANPIDNSQAGGGFRSTLVTGMVTVTDGKLTIDSIGGTNTEIQYLEIERVPDLTPGDGRAADEDFSFFVAPVADTLEGQVSIALGPNGELPTDIDPSAMFVIGVNLQADGNRGPNIAHVENIKLVETLTGAEVAIDVQISGGADSLTIRPLQTLKENTSYTLKVQDVMDLGSIEDANGALRQFQDLTTSFVTGEAAEDVAREVAFTTDVLLNGFADGAGGFTAVEFGPDGKLYVATITGEIYRWEVNTDGTINETSKETLTLSYLDAGGGERRGIVGFTFDPSDPNTIWITDNAPIPREAKAFDTPEFSGRVSKISLGNDGSFTGATAETYISGLPRSGGDHLTNSLEFRANPNAGEAGEPEYLLYLSQGSNSAAGAPDGAWGNRPERLLNAAILEIDPTRDAPVGGFDVRTEPIDLDDAPTTTFPASQFNADGTYPDSYNPFAEGAVLKIFASGVRNAYDLVWHSNGNLYVPTNGTASGGKTPNDPTQAGLDTVISNSPKQYDYFFTVEEGGYYGHPNVLRDQYVLNGGNPTSGGDPNEVVGGNDGNSNTDGYQTGVQPDEDYDLDGVYNLGYNRSPNGAVEYTGNAFGSNLKGAILIAQFSTGDNVRMIRVDAEGKVIGDDVLRRPDGSVIDDYIDPLDIIQNPVTGQLYLMTLNRGTGASQLILLTPAPGGVTQDVTADVGGDLALVAFDVSDPEAAIFQVNGLDDDITAIRVRFNGGPETSVTLDAQKRFVFDVAQLTGPTTASIRITDNDLNEATASTQFTPGEEPTTPEFVSLVTIQAEDKTPGDGTAVTVPLGGTAQIQIRDSANPEQGVTGPGYVNGLRPGAFGIDGNTVNTDGVPGGYADFGSTNADYMTFTFTVPADSAGSAILKFRYSNGGTADRPLQVEVNGTVVDVQSFVPTAATPGSDGWTQWAFVEVPVSLIPGQNSVTLRAVSATGPNIDQMEVLVAADSDSVPNDGEVVLDGVTYVLYEAENAALGGAPAVVTEDRDQSGAFVDFQGPDSESVTWTIEVDAAGSYGLDILYALGAGKAARPMTMSVNGQTAETLPFVANSNAAESTWGPQSATVQLAAGVNTITLTAPGGVGPNVDMLRVTKEPVSVFEPDYAEISGSGRIETETQDGSAHILNGSTVEYFLTVAADGVYKLDTAANANAANGQGLTWFINGVEVDESAFPGVGTAGEQSIYVELEAGTQYRIRVVSDAPGASGLDYLDVSPAPGNANADIAVQSLDPAFLENRLHFSFLEDPDAVAPDAADRDYKDSGTVRISNTGSEPLTFTDFELDGPFVLANPSVFDGLSLAAGQSIDVTVLFNRAAYTPPTSNVDATSTVFQGALKLITNDADDPITTIDLAGFWQARDEGGHEPNVNEVWRIFGFGNVIEGLTTRGGGENSTLSTKDVFAKTDVTEVLSPYWKIADGVTEAKITHIAAFHGTGGATIHLHNPGNKNSNVLLWNHEGTDNQRLLPNMNNDTTFSTQTFNNGTIPDGWAGTEAFGISVAGLSTDPRLNPRGDELVEGAQQGHTVKIFQALDADGNVIPNVYLGIMDYTGINYDYNDNMFVIEGIEPVGFGQDLRVAGLDAAAADERLVFTNIDDPANAQQSFRNEATITIANDGFAPLTIDGIAVGDPSAFQIVGTVPTSIPAGGSAQVTVRFIGAHAGTDAGAQLFKSTLTINSNDFAEGVKVIQLAGLAQEFSENGSEPTVEQVVEAFGYGTDMAQGELAGGGAVETVGDEVLMPYLQKLDSSKPVEVIQMAAFLQQNNVARLGYHQLNSDQVTNLFAQDDQDYQTVSPNPHVAGSGAGSGVASGTINQNGPFGLFISVDGRPTYASWTDPEANRVDPDFGQLVSDDQGHLVRFFQALDTEGNVIEGTYIAIQDYPGAGNYDYNDHMFVIKNVKPYELTAANDADDDGVNDALQNDADDDGTVDFFDPNSNPQEPGGENRGDFVVGVNFGGAAIANDPVLGVPLLAQSNSRVTVSGSVTPGAGTDVASNPNGANATAGSAFKTYEDGSNWTASISVPNGTYVVVLHTQETYWNASGMRQFDIAVNGQQVVSNLDPFAAAGGGDKPIAIETVVTVTNGQVQINLSADIDNAALNAVTIYEYEAPDAGQQPVSGTPFLVDADGVTIDASNYDNGGQGVAYNDAAGLQGGTNGGRAGSDVEQTGGGDIGWIAAGDWVEYTIDVAQAGVYDIDLLLANGGATGRSASVAFYKEGAAQPYATSGTIANPSTGSYGTFATRGVDGIALDAGTQVVRVTFAGGSQDFRSFSIIPQANPQQPFGGTAPSILNGLLTVDATNFDNGGQGVAYNDNAGLDGGNTGLRPGRDVEFVGADNDIGHVKPGEWVEYTVNVTSAGTYAFSVNAKTPVSGATITVSQAGGQTLGVVNLADGHAGGSNFGSAAFQQSSEVPITLAAGMQTLRLAFNGPLASNGYVLDLKSFTLEAESVQTAFGGTTPILGDSTLVVDATSYDNGGEGVAYHDAAGLQGGSNGGRAGSAVEVTGAGDIGWVEAGEWLEYTVNVAEAGTYSLNLLTALGDGGGPNRSITASFTNGSSVETVTVGTPRTGTWSNFQNTQPAEVDLEAGTTVVRLTFNGGSQDIRSFSLAPADNAPSLLTALFGDEDQDGTFDASAQEVRSVQRSEFGRSQVEALFGDEQNWEDFWTEGLEAAWDAFSGQGIGSNAPNRLRDLFQGDDNPLFARAAEALETAWARWAEERHDHPADVAQENSDQDGPAGNHSNVFGYDMIA